MFLLVSCNEAVSHLTQEPWMLNLCSLRFYDGGFVKTSQTIVHSLLLQRFGSKLLFNPPVTWAGPCGSTRPLVTGLEVDLHPVLWQGWAVSLTLPAACSLPLPISPLWPWEKANLGRRGDLLHFPPSSWGFWGQQWSIHESLEASIVPWRSIENWQCLGKCPHKSEDGVF